MPEKFDSSDGKLTEQEQKLLHGAAEWNQTSAELNAIRNDKDAFVADMKEYIADLQSFVTAWWNVDMEKDSLLIAYNTIRSKYPELQLPDLFEYLKWDKGKEEIKRMERAYNTPEAKQAIEKAKEEESNLKSQIPIASWKENKENPPIPEEYPPVAETPVAEITKPPVEAKKKNSDEGFVPTPRAGMIDENAWNPENPVKPETQEELNWIVEKLKKWSVIILTFTGCGTCKSLENYANKNPDNRKNATFINCDLLDKSKVQIQWHIDGSYPWIYVMWDNNKMKNYGSQQKWEFLPNDEKGFASLVKAWYNNLKTNPDQLTA